MADSHAGVEIRSFRVCFSIERRLHKIDRWQIPLPYGMPVRGIVYAAAVLFVVLLVERMPILSALLSGLHPIVRYGFLPVAAGYLLTELKLDGRSGHAVVRSWIRMHVQPRRIAAFRSAGRPGQVRLGAVAVVPDERDPSLRRGVIHGPGPVALLGEAKLHARGRTLRVQPTPGTARRGRKINLRAGQRMVIR